MSKDHTPFTLIKKLTSAGVLLKVEEMLARRFFPTGEGALLFCALHAHYRAGHLCLKEKNLSHLVSDPMLQKEWEKGLVMADSPYLKEDRGAFYLTDQWELEEKIIQEIKRLSGEKKEALPITFDSRFTSEQKEAILHALEHPVSIITGGPGTGKTSVATQIALEFVSKGKLFILLAAPTGKAASHLLSKVGDVSDRISGGTIHSLLKESGPLPADLIIIDEASMVDTALFARLLEKVGSETHLVLMGDQHQLPAVEGGSVFADLVASNIKKTILTKVFRSDRKEILDKAQAILAGKGDLINIDLGLRSGTVGQMYEALWKHVKEKFPSCFTQRPDPEELLKSIDDFRILSTLRKGAFGVDALNRFLYSRFKEKKKGHFVAPVMITKSHLKKQLSNGDVGILLDDEAFFSGGRSFALFDLPPFEYAYALSVHKSQGSEYKEVLALVPKGSEAFGKEVLYTAVTRAKETLLIDGHPEQIDQLLCQNSCKMSQITAKLCL